MIDRQVQDGLRASQFVFPVLNLFCDCVGAAVLALPLGVFRILHREFGEVGIFSVDESFVTARQFAEQNRNGPAIRDDVVHRQH